MRRNVGFLKWVELYYFGNKARVEIVSNKDGDAKNLKPLVIKVAETLAEKHPDLPILGIEKTVDPWNYHHPLLWGLFKGYIIHVPLEYDPFAIKKTCMELELDEEGNRIADIDIYLASPYVKISRKEL